MNTPAERQFLEQVAELGFLYQAGEEANYIHSPVNSHRWRLHQEGDRWILYVRDVPQIVFHPPEVIKFLQKQQARQVELQSKS